MHMELDKRELQNFAKNFHSRKTYFFKKKFTKPSTNNVLDRMAKVGKLSVFQKDASFQNVSQRFIPSFI